MRLQLIAFSAAVLALTPVTASAGALLDFAANCQKVMKANHGDRYTAAQISTSCTCSATALAKEGISDRDFRLLIRSYNGETLPDDLDTDILLNLDYELAVQCAPK